MITGYAGIQYLFIYSKVIAADIGTLFTNENILTPGVGIKYRREILERGRMRNADVLLNNLLGRPTNSEAFSSKLKLDQ